jgi:predicted alternative tryptophan synthase beta-subunit
MTTKVLTLQEATRATLLCPTLTEGKLRYDFGDASGLTPKHMMYSLGAGFVPPPHAGGLRYHGIAPLVSYLVKLGLSTSAATDSWVWRHTKTVEVPVKRQPLRALPLPLDLKQFLLYS